MRTVFLLLILSLFSSIIALGQEANPVQIPDRPVARVEFVGNTVVSDKELAKVVPIKPGDQLTEQCIEAAITAIKNAYTEHGYLAAIQSNLLLGFAETGVLEFPITEVRVTKVRIEGLMRTKEFAVRRQLNVKPGDLYNITALRRDASKLSSFNAFSSINADVLEAPTFGEVIVTWKLVEKKKTGAATVGGSYAPSSKLVGSVQYTKANFRGLLEQLQIATSIITVGGKFSTQLSYFTPWIADKTSLNSSIFSIARFRFSQSLLNTGNTSDYYERRRGAQFTATKTLSPIRTLAVSPRFENVSVVNLPVQDFTIPLTTASGKIAAISGLYVIDTRDSPIYPTHGTLKQAYLEPMEFHPQENNANYVAKGAVEFRHIYPIDRITTNPTAAQPDKKPRVLAIRGMLGTSSGTLPFFEQYFIGGVTGLRGYTESRFWGKNRFYLSTEYRQPISKSFVGLAFLDVGDAWGSRYQFKPGVNTDFNQHVGFSPKIGVGVGARYLSSAGLIGLDVGWGEGIHTYLVVGERF